MAKHQGVSVDRRCVRKELADYASTLLAVAVLFDFLRVALDEDVAKVITAYFVHRALGQGFLARTRYGNNVK